MEVILGGPGWGRDGEHRQRLLQGWGSLVMQSLAARNDHHHLILCPGFWESRALLGSSGLGSAGQWLGPRWQELGQLRADQASHSLSFSLSEFSTCALVWASSQHGGLGALKLFREHSSISVSGVEAGRPSMTQPGLAECPSFHAARWLVRTPREARPLPGEGHRPQHCSTGGRQRIDSYILKPLQGPCQGVLGTKKWGCGG